MFRVRIVLEKNENVAVRHQLPQTSPKDSHSSPKLPQTSPNLASFFSKNILILLQNSRHL